MNYMTAGEVCGQALVALVDGVPAGLRLSKLQAESDLKRCQDGYALDPRPYRYVEIESGMHDRRTTGAPVAFLVYGDNDAAEALESSARTVPRPGRGDLLGVLKTSADSMESVTARLDALDEAACVVAASVAREFLAELDVEVRSYVASIGSNAMLEQDFLAAAPTYEPMAIEFSPVRCPSERTSAAMANDIETARRAGETLGGTFRVVVTGLLPGLGGFSSRCERLSAKLSAALFSLPYVTGVQIGAGFDGAALRGPAAHDGIRLGSSGFARTSNVSGGIEDGMTTGEPLVITVAVAAPAPAGKPAESLDLDTLQPAASAAAGGSVCVVPGLAVAAEAEVAFVLASAYMEKFGSDSMTDIRASIDAYEHRLKMAAR